MKVLHVTNNRTNCYLLPLEKGWLMIDTGLPDTFSSLLQLLNQQSIQINEINYLLITHFHPDHAGLTQNLCDLGITLVIHEEQYPYMSKLNLFYKKNRKANYKDIIPSQALILTDESSARFFEEIGIHGELITTPGHSDDSVSLVLPNECAFTGDLPSFYLKEAYNDFIIEDSWDMLLQYQPKIIYPSHADPYNVEF